MLESLLDIAERKHDVIAFTAVLLVIYLAVDGMHQVAGHFWRKRRGADRYEHNVAKQQSNGDWKWEKQ